MTASSTPPVGAQAGKVVLGSVGERPDDAHPGSPVDAQGCDCRGVDEAPGCTHGAPVGGQVPDDTRWRDALAEAAQAELACGTAWYIATGESIAAALLPTVARIVAQELRDAADMYPDGSFLRKTLIARADHVEARRG